jgi:hypothetical protein
MTNAERFRPIGHSGLVIGHFTPVHFTDLAIQIIADDKIRSAIERGEFDRLPGLGRPLHFDATDDPDWWIRRKLREEDLTKSPCLAEPQTRVFAPAILRSERLAHVPPHGYPGRES